MTATHALPCPKCQRVLDPLAWHDDASGTCRRCTATFAFIGFPALTHVPARIVPKAVLVPEHATCFFHAENQAEAICDSCGRMLCPVCAVDFSGRRLCPSCVAVVRRAPTQASDQRVLYGSLALTLALLPLLLVLVWFVTIVTAPIALGLVIVGWRKPASLVTGGRTKLVVAGLIALAEIVGWILLIVFLVLRKK